MFETQLSQRTDHIFYPTDVDISKLSNIFYLEVLVVSLQFRALEEFHTVRSSVQTLMMMMTGEYGYQNLQVVDELSALIFYSFYVILVFFVLVNMCESLASLRLVPTLPLSR